MGFFSSLFGPKKEELARVAESGQDPQAISESKQEEVADNGGSDGNNFNPIQYGTKMPIDVIYAYIGRDYEQQGYNDAMCNADCSYKDSKKMIIKNELKRLFEQVGLRYKSDLRDIEVQIDIVEQQGLFNTASSLKARKDTFVEHMGIMKGMEDSLDRDAQQMLSMIDSYERGFLKGLAAKSNSLLHNNGNI